MRFSLQKYLCRRRRDENEASPHNGQHRPFTGLRPDTAKLIAENETASTRFSRSPFRRLSYGRLKRKEAHNVLSGHRFSRPNQPSRLASPRAFPAGTDGHLPVRIRRFGRSSSRERHRHSESTHPLLGHVKFLKKFQKTTKNRLTTGGFSAIMVSQR